MVFQVDERKITHYLLTSRSKAPFFAGIGYTLADWTVLRDDLLQHPLTAALEGTVSDMWGTKTMFCCEMPRAPNGRQYCVRTVWQLRAGGAWIFVTGYPQPSASLRP